jgi:PDZ domain-containing secreted protein
MNILISLCSSYDELIASTKNPDTLSEVKIKQNERESLTNISDFTFEFKERGKGGLGVEGRSHTGR